MPVTCRDLDVRTSYYSSSPISRLGLRGVSTKNCDIHSISVLSIRTSEWPEQHQPPTRCAHSASHVISNARIKGRVNPDMSKEDSRPRLRYFGSALPQTTTTKSQNSGCLCRSRFYAFPIFSELLQRLLTYPQTKASSTNLISLGRYESKLGTSCE